MPLNYKQRSASAHQFSMIPRAEIPRARFHMPNTLKTSFDAGYLVPIFCEEVLPGDSWKVRMTAFCRLATPIVPVMDNLHLESFFFFVPNRLVWTNWVKFMGEQVNPGDSISYAVPVCSPVGGYAANSLQDYFGLGTAGQVTANAWSHSALPLRAYNQIYNEWFRDENLVNSAPKNVGDGPDGTGDYVLRRRSKRADYFTRALPWPLKGGTSVTLPLGTSATVRTTATDLVTGTASAVWWKQRDAAPLTGGKTLVSLTEGGNQVAAESATNLAAAGVGIYPSNLYADLSTATAATINQLRQAFQIQKLLERDARGGTRYTEIIHSHFGVISPDARLQRPEYLGGGHTPVAINPVAQTSATNLTGSTTPFGSLSGIGTALAHGHGFSQSFTEHGYIIGLVNVRADLTYQQGLRRHWSRSTRYDFYFPAFAMLGEQAVLNKEIYLQANASDALVFGYQERWAEYRYVPNQITGLMRSTSAGTIDIWHIAQRFSALPTLGQTWIEDNPPLSRVLAVGAGANGQQLLMDAYFDTTVARPLPMYSVPGLIDHF